MEVLNRLIEIIKKEDKKIKFENLAKEWIGYKQISIKRSTYCNYLFIIEKYLNPEFKEKDVDDIQNCNDYIKKLSKNLSPKTVRDILNVLKAILKYYETKYNCMLQTKEICLPKLERNMLKILSQKEKIKLENYCIRENTLKTLGIIVCLNTGMRVGEICCLKWKNIDLESKNIYVERTLQRIYNKNNRNSNVIIAKPKTKCSIRSIPINKKLYEILKPLSKKYKNEDYFLSGDSNKVVEPRNYQYTFKSILKRCNITPYKFHILRHTFATNCIDVGMDAKSLSELLGHSSVDITLEIYVHSSDKIKKKYLERL